MRPDDIYIPRVQAATPFEPFELELSSGARLAVRHPENLAVTENMGAVATEDGQDLILFAPAQVCALHPLGNGKRRQARKRS